MRIFAVIAVLATPVFPIQTLAAPDLAIVLGDGTIDGTRLKPYSLTWQQCSLQDGQSSPPVALHEELSALDAQTYRIRQTSIIQEGINSQTDLILNRHSMAPQKFEIEVSRNGAKLQHQVFEFTRDGYTGTKTQGNEETNLSGVATSKMLHGMALGLPLATIRDYDQPVNFAASMVTFDATYEVTATSVGTEIMTHDGREVEALLVDVKWNHVESGDVYAPGPDASGGRFWIVPSPPANFPYVPRYKTDSYVVEFVPKYCK